MIRKIIILLIATFALTFNAVAGTDGELILKKNQPSEIKDCSEKFNRATFAFNQALDGIIFKPVANVYLFSQLTDKLIKEDIENIKSINDFETTIKDYEINMSVVKAK